MTEIPAVEAGGLAKSFGPTQALAGVDLRLPQGSILGMLGPNGAGKTTAVRVLATLLRPDAGWARVLGFDVLTEPAAVRRRIGLTGQYVALDDYLTGKANLVMIGQLCRLSGRQARQRADDLLERFSLARDGARTVKTYSGGMRRRLDLAASLIGEPDVLFLDEPTTGLDPRSRAVMWQVMRELASHGATLLLTTQYLDEADQLADRIVVMDSGRVIAEGTPDQLKAKVGDNRLALTLAAGSDLEAAASAVASLLNGPVELDAARLRLHAPVPARDGVTTEIICCLDAAGVKVSDALMSRPSLDDVFLALTGHKAAGEQKRRAAGGAAA